jgi:hypothetical protein
MEHCYFYIDYTGAKKPGEGRIWPLCLEHGKKKENAWLWRGGYGTYDIRCHECDKLIYEANNNSPDARKSSTNK